MTEEEKELYAREVVSELKNGSKRNYQRIMTTEDIIALKDFLMDKLRFF